MDPDYQAPSTTSRMPKTAAVHRLVGAASRRSTDRRAGVAEFVPRGHGRAPRPSTGCGRHFRCPRCGAGTLATVINPNVRVHETAIVEDGAEIGDGTSVWHHGHVRSSAHIGAGCVLGKNVYVACREAS